MEMQYMLILKNKQDGSPVRMIGSRSTLFSAILNNQLDFEFVSLSEDGWV